MLVAQSLQKHYVFERNGETLPTEGYTFQRTGMELVELRKCMRTTVNTYNAINTAQNVVTSSPTMLYVPMLNAPEKKTSRVNYTKMSIHLEMLKTRLQHQKKQLEIRFKQSIKHIMKVTH